MMFQMSGNYCSQHGQNSKFWEGISGRHNNISNVPQILFTLFGSSHFGSRFETWLLGLISLLTMAWWRAHTRCSPADINDVALSKSQIRNRQRKHTKQCLLQALAFVAFKPTFKAPGGMLHGKICASDLEKFRQNMYHGSYYRTFRSGGKMATENFPQYTRAKTITENFPQNTSGKTITKNFPQYGVGKQHQRTFSSGGTTENFSQ